jgi:hypothetical protein
VREAVILRGVAQAAKFSFAEMARQVADALVSTHRGIATGALARPSSVWQDLRETLERSQSPQVYELLGQELRRRVLVTLRTIGFDPAQSRLLLTLRAFHRDPERWATMTNVLLQKLRRSSGRSR